MPETVSRFRDLAKHMAPGFALLNKGNWSSLLSFPTPIPPHPTSLFSAQQATQLSQ